MKFAINLIFQQVVFCFRPKNQDKNLNILRTKRAFKMKKKHFSSFLKGFQFFGRWEPDFKEVNMQPFYKTLVIKPFSNTLPRAF